MTDTLDAAEGLATAMALLDGRTLETIPIMEYVCERTYRALAIEELRGGLQ